MDVPSARARLVDLFIRLAPCLLAIACTVDSEDGATFGNLPATSAPTTTTTPGDSSTSALQSDTGSSGVGSSSGVTMAGTSVASTDTTGSEDTAAADTANTSGGGQPADGMYSACETPAECFGLITCFVVQVGDGFCTNTGCPDATVCDASPGGTATPACVTVQIGGNPQQVCALDCSGGKTCPSPMECLTLVGQMLCA